MAGLLLDQNLSRRLVDLLEPQFPGTRHVALLGMARATDLEIFDFAGRSGFAILSKDTDFHHLSFRYGAPPKVVWIRLGNASTAEIAACLLASAVRIRRFLSDDEATVMAVLPRS
jgi:predicted nuclease of predicted toxin-antitoxin system